MLDGVQLISKEVYHSKKDTGKLKYSYWNDIPWLYHCHS